MSGVTRKLPVRVPLVGLRSVPTVRAASLRWIILTVVGVLGVYTVLTIAVPSLRIDVYSPDLRVVMEMAGLSITLFTALALLLPGDGEVGVPRDAFVAALVTLGLSNAVFGVLPVLIRGAPATGEAFGFYPWIAGRYVAGLLFIAATVGRPRLGVGRYLLVTIGVLALVDGAFVLSGDALPLPLEELEEYRGGMSVLTASLWASLLITAAPGVLFAVGAVLAWRVFARTSAQLYWWLALALWTQVLAQVHEIMYPAVLGPRITSADALRSLVLLLLLLGASLKVRGLWHDRHSTLVMQEQDLETHRRLLAEAEAFADEEEGFRSLVVHELATPLAALRAYAHVVSEQVGPDRRLERALRGLRTESERLQTLIRRMEELRRVETGQLELHLTPRLLRPLLEEIVPYISALPGGHRIEVTCEDVRVMVDAARIGQALRNLAANAVAYAPPETLVWIDGRRVGGGRIAISVEDEGPGIPPEERERLLKKYQRGTSARGRQGTGLGLYLSRRIAEAHGGRLFIADGRGGRGTRIVIEVDEA